MNKYYYESVKLRGLWYPVIREYGTNKIVKASREGFHFAFGASDWVDRNFNGEYDCHGMGYKYIGPRQLPG